MRIDGEKIYIRFMEVADAKALLDLNMRNMDFFKDAVSTNNESFYTLKGVEAKLNDIIPRMEQGLLYSFGIFDRETDRLVGNIALSQIFRGQLQSCNIGYYLDKDFNGRGYMSEAVRLAVGFAFNELKLHRIEAGVAPHNLGSMRVLEKAGFQKEGIARKNVLLNGEWHDHQILAMLEEDFERING